ncbi:MAG TPA: alpha/beta hydrolase [Solirubrobacteraceae bacterium]|nr:alpha/beta hydrolase [Solirubrobacteraceae bacterium]
MTLKRCAGARAWCGTLARPLDPRRASGPRIRIGFKWIRALPGAARAPALVAVEGGPGYPSIGSEVEYRGIFGPVLRDRNLLLVDNRGTGRSALVDCPRLQRYPGVTTAARFPRLVAACARTLRRRHGLRDAPDLFGTAYAVDDLAAVLRALRLRRVDLYGDSYGSWFAQSFMGRHPDRLRAVVLDSTYPVRGLDPWYASSGEVARRALDAVCARDPACAIAAPGSATARLAALVARVRSAPLVGATRDADGSRISARVDPRTLADMVQDAGSDPVIYRELDASVRAALAGDAAPILRLAGQSETYDHGVSTADYFSNGLYMAVSCTDYPMLFSMRSSPAQRRRELAASIRGGPRTAFAPFTLREWLRIGAYSEPYSACLDWPRPVAHRPVVPAHRRPLPARVPVLVLGGDLDSLTPLSDAELFVPRLGRTVRVVTLANTVHVTSEGDTTLSVGAACARAIIRAFVRAPRRIARLDTGCAARIAPVHTPGAYPLRLADVRPAATIAGPDPGLEARRAAVVAANALADAVIRRFYSGVAHGPGLRGGRFTTTGDGPIRYRLRGVRYVADATVAGAGTWALAAGATAGALAVRLPSGASVRVRVAWTQRSRSARATVAGATLALPAP